MRGKYAGTTEYRLRLLERKLEHLTELLQVVAAWAAVHDESGQVMRLVAEAYADARDEQPGTEPEEPVAR